MSVENHIFPSHFRDFITQLNAHKVEYMLIGGFAMGAYGHMRGTNDLDIFINATDENAERAMNACLAYGIDKNEVQKEMFITPKMIGIGQPPLRIEVLKKLDNVDFKYAFQRIKKTTIDGIEIKVVIWPGIRKTSSLLKNYSRNLSGEEIRACQCRYHKTKVC